VESIRSLAPEFPFEVARRGYSVGTRVLEAVLPEHQGPTAVVPVTMGDEGLDERDGIEARAVVLVQLSAALTIIRDHDRTGSRRSAASARSAWARSPTSSAGTGTTWPSCGSTSTPT
jgi:hypothetical protein